MAGLLSKKRLSGETMDISLPSADFHTNPIFHEKIKNDTILGCSRLNAVGSGANPPGSGRRYFFNAATQSSWVSMIFNSSEPVAAVSPTMMAMAATARSRVDCRWGSRR
ncbi:hypothetical protein A8950_1923 [Dongia mobilis]|uniref:Uncharacterized protein n=1 Tax=Dongia mobilis TaxID=578943 RepID=A0A4R6WMK4_9PROT|nr:hypothetical protein A8950_1923 [Dongia mobilis]